MFALDFRPSNLSEFVGQKHLLGANKPILNMLENKNFIHCFFYGPPGSGKTTLSRIIARELGMEFYEFNATSLKIDSIRALINKDSLFKPLIFIDEIHRLNKAQQEVLLPFMEDFSAIFLGASTYNPFFSLTNAIRSRSMLFEFKALNRAEMGQILDFALAKSKITATNEIKDYLISTANGDARAMLNLLDIAKDNLSLENLQNIRPNALGEGVSEARVHYDLISALIKSVRGSDENAAIYYLARLINAGESADFIARRLVILASEDIGNANPNALILANAALQAVLQIGFPEARIILAQCAIYLANCPKSNSAYKAIDEALDFVKSAPNPPPPPNICHFCKDYKYPHDVGGWVEQNYFPLELGQKEFVKRREIGFEKTLNEWQNKIKGE